MSDLQSASRQSVVLVELQLHDEEQRRARREWLGLELGSVSGSGFVLELWTRLVLGLWLGLGLDKGKVYAGGASAP